MIAGETCRYWASIFTFSFRIRLSHTRVVRIRFVLAAAVSAAAAAICLLIRMKSVRTYLTLSLLWLWAGSHRYIVHVRRTHTDTAEGPTHTHSHTKKSMWTKPTIEFSLQRCTDQAKSSARVSSNGIERNVVIFISLQQDCKTQTISRATPPSEWRATGEKKSGMDVLHLFYGNDGGIHECAPDEIVSCSNILFHFSFFLFCGPCRVPFSAHTLHRQKQTQKYTSYIECKLL